MASVRPLTKSLRSHCFTRALSNQTRSICNPPTHQYYRPLSTTTTNNPPPKLSWLDLRGSGLSAAERLAIEEVLLRHDPLERCWGIIGVHEPTQNKILNFPLPPHDDWNTQRLRATMKSDDAYGHENVGTNQSCAIILGIGGKAERLVNIEAAKKDGVLVLKRFSGGGTVVVDHSSLWTTFIGRNAILPHVKPFPKEIMEWSAEAIFGPTFRNWNTDIVSSTGGNNMGNSLVSKKKSGRQTLVFKGPSCGVSGSDGESLMLPLETLTQPLETVMLPFEEKPSEYDGNTQLPLFRLKENDYVLGKRKMGGNAQAIVSGGWLHHTSFLWDYDNMNMEYLTLPDKRPLYRGDRSHDEFLVKLKDYYGKESDKNSFFTNVKKATGESFELEEVALGDVLDIVNEKFGGLQDWFHGKCRTKPIKI